MQLFLALVLLAPIPAQPQEPDQDTSEDTLPPAQVSEAEPRTESQTEQEDSQAAPQTDENQVQAVPAEPKTTEEEVYQLLDEVRRQSEVNELLLERIESLEQFQQVDFLRALDKHVSSVAASHGADETGLGQLLHHLGQIAFRDPFGLGNGLGRGRQLRHMTNHVHQCVQCVRLRLTNLHV